MFTTSLTPTLPHIVACLPKTPQNQLGSGLPSPATSATSATNWLVVTPLLRWTELLCPCHLSGLCWDLFGCSPFIARGPGSPFVCHVSYLCCTLSGCNPFTLLPTSWPVGYGNPFSLFEGSDSAGLHDSSFWSCADLQRWIRLPFCHRSPSSIGLWPTLIPSHYAQPTQFSL